MKKGEARKKEIHSLVQVSLKARQQNLLTNLNWGEPQITIIR